MMKWVASRIALVLIVCGTGLFVYGILGFTPSQGSYQAVSYQPTTVPASGYSYEMQSRLEAVLGAVLIVGGYLRLKFVGTK
jgi:hypothetical protein